MQTASSNFSMAMTGSSGTWAPPQVLADWVGDGYDLIKTPDIRDYFNRTASAGFGQADSDHIWTPLNTPASDYFVAGGAAVISMSSLGQRGAAIGGMITDFDAKFRVSTNQLAVGAAQRSSVSFRIVDSSNFYYLRCDFNTDQVIGWGLTKVVGGTHTTVTSGLVTGIAHAVGRKFWVRGQGIGSTFRVKIWLDGTVEPTTWSGTGTDTTQTLAGPGQIGVFVTVVAGNTNTTPLVWTIDSFTNGAWDDLTGQAGAVAVHQALDDGMPSDVTYTSGADSTSSASLPVGGRAGLAPQQYWSQDRTDSPIAGYDRDVAAMQISPGAVTASGIERVSVFTGQMAEAPVTGITAAIDAVSATRLKLTNMVQPPTIMALYEGLTADFPVSWTLAQCGLYVSPPPRTGCRWWTPAHGSMRQFLPTANPLFSDHIRCVSSAPGLSIQIPTPFVSGPFHLAAFYQVTATQAQEGFWDTPQFAPGVDLISKAASAGRVEFWVRGDATDTSNAAGWGVDLDKLAGFKVGNVGGAGTVECGVNLTRHVFVTVDDGAGHTATLASAAAVPSDGAWHFIGAAWDIANKKLWVDNSGTVASTGASTLVTSSLPATDNYDNDNDYPHFRSFLPIAEIQVTSGTHANPDNYPWVSDSAYTWTVGAVLRPSLVDLQVLAEPLPVEAATYIAGFAQAELAMTRTDELDRYCYLPIPYWAEATPQTIVETLTPDTNVGADLAVTRDLTKIRNQVTVNYTDVRISNGTGAIADLLISFTVYTLPPGTTVLNLALIDGAAALSGPFFYLLTAADVAAGRGSWPFPGHFMCANTANDGSGTFATSAHLTVTVTSWDAGKAVVTVVNTSGTTYYTINAPGVIPYIDIRGRYAVASAAAVTVQDDANILKRGIRGMAADAKAIQDLEAATFIASELLARLKYARKQMSLTVRGDPRRQPGDLVRVADPNGTNINGLWRVLSIDHTIDGASYTQTLSLMQAALVGVWDQSTWDDGSIWGA